MTGKRTNYPGRLSSPNTGPQGCRTRLPYSYHLRPQQREGAFPLSRTRSDRPHPLLTVPLPVSKSPFHPFPSQTTPPLSLSLSQVQNFVQIDSLYYAGSHGLDIAGPPLAGEAVVHQPAPWALSLMDSIHDRLVALVAPIEGSSVEHNTYCVSVHYRLCVDRWKELEEIVAATVAPHEQLTVSRGRKVFEV